MKLASLLLALALDALLGDPPNRLHPVAAMGAFIRRAEARAPAPDPARQLAYGALLTGAGAALFAIIPAALARVVRLSPAHLALEAVLSAPRGSRTRARRSMIGGEQSAAEPCCWLSILVDALLLKSVFSLRRLWEAGGAVQAALDGGDLPQARRLAAWHLVSRDTGALGAGHTASAAVESLAENLTDSFLAPLLAFAVGGPPLAWAYRFVNTADSMIGYHDARHEYLGKFAARLDDALNWLPARLAGLLIVVAAPLAGGSAAAAWRTMQTQHGRTASPNAGWSMSAAAGALGVTLEKPDHYRLAGGPGLPAPADLGRARRLLLGGAALGAAVAGLLCLMWKASAGGTRAQFAPRRSATGGRVPITRPVHRAA